MQTFKRVLCAVLIFVITFTAVSAVIIVPFLNSETENYQDSRLRKNLAGTIDCVVLGASQGGCAFVPQIMDKELGCSSYNLSSAMIPMYAREYIFEKELKRNDIKTVIIEISHNTLNREYDGEYENGDSRFIMKLDSPRERLSYMMKYVKINDLANIYSRMIVSGINGIETRLERGSENVDYEAKGFDPKPATDITLSDEEAKEIHNSEIVRTDYNRQNIDILTSIIDTCKAKKIRTIIAVVPLPDRLLWQYDGADKFLEWMKNYCDEQGCEFFDFNLLKSRYEIFNDKTSWYKDYTHMSSDGGESFTTEFTKVIKTADAGQDISDMFYSSYVEAVKDSPYNK